MFSNYSGIEGKRKNLTSVPLLVVGFVPFGEADCHSPVGLNPTYTRH